MHVCLEWETLIYEETEQLLDLHILGYPPLTLAHGV
jgi:hypothetical protein